MTRVAKSFHRRAADAVADIWAAEDELTLELRNAYLALRDPEVSIGIAAMGDPYGGWDMGQLFCLRSLMWMLAEGYLKMGRIMLGHVPQRDSDRETNQRHLEGLQDGISAHVDPAQRNHEGDGTLEWNGAHVEWEVGAPTETTQYSRSAALEIGYTDASNICYQLAKYGAVARWPYDHEFLTVLVEDPVATIKRWSISRDALHPVSHGLGTFLNFIRRDRLFGPKYVYGTFPGELEWTKKYGVHRLGNIPIPTPDHNSTFETSAAPQGASRVSNAMFDGSGEHLKSGQTI